MRWFKRYAVCKECGVYFEPMKGITIRRDLCFTHRQQVMERDYRKETVMKWAEANWERLEEMCEQERMAANQSGYAALSGLAQSGNGQFDKNLAWQGMNQMMSRRG